MKNLIGVILILATVGVCAQEVLEPVALTAALKELSELTAFVDANVSFCSLHAPQTSEPVKRAALEWRNTNQLILLKAVSQALDSSLISDAQTRLERYSAFEQLSALLTQAPQWCQAFPELLSSSDWHIKERFSQQLDLLEPALNTLQSEPVTRLASASLAPVPNPSYAELIKAGHNPKTDVIRTEFRCYDTLTSSSYPDFIVQLSEITYQSSWGKGDFVQEGDELSWTSGVLAEADSELEVSKFGQSFELDKLTINGYTSVYNCFQQGAREAAALVQFELSAPEGGSYVCQNVESSETTTLELFEDSQYKIGPNTGLYSVTPLGSSSQVNWLSGPLQGQKARYSEQEGSGLRQLSMTLSSGVALPGFVSASSELSVVCKRSSEPLYFARYGDEAAPAPPNPGTPLQGLFVKHNINQSVNSGSQTAAYFQFFPDGHLISSTPEPKADTDCSRTLPNGAPYCETYRVEGNKLIYSSRGEQHEHELEAYGNSLKPVGYEPVTAADPARLDGRFMAYSFYSSGACFDNCYSSYSEYYFTFTPDGTFAYSTDGQTFSSLDTALGSSSAAAFRANASAGTYTLNGNTLSLRYNDGRVAEHFIATLPTGLAVDNRLYTPFKDE